MSKIVKVELLRENLELTRPYTIAYKTISAVENCFVFIHTSSGKMGIGAANPSKQVVGESVDDCWQALKSAEELLIGKDILHFEALKKAIESRYIDNPGAKAALDIALYDLLCHELDIELGDFLGRKIPALPTSITIGIMGVEETIENAKEYVGMGFRYLKVKLGNDLEEDIERMAKLREQFGNKINIRIDANQGYDDQQIQRFFHQNTSFQIELIEQPLHRKLDAQMLQLPFEIKKLIAADESLIDLEDAIRLAVPKKHCGIYNIKLMKCGGIAEGQRIADFANRNAIDLMWGCNDESIVSITAALHVALAQSNTKYLDLDGSLDLARDLVSGGFKIQNGVMSPTGGNGLGVTIL